ncbi:E2 ubiquitin-conjugating enzyme [Sarracenia purpurea var. burkii]
MEDDCFKKGAEVEVSFEDEGFRGSWYTATVIRTVSKKNNKIFVEFHNLKADDRGRKPLREFVNIILVRPVPPREPRRSFKLSEEVDAFHNDEVPESRLIFATRIFGYTASGSMGIGFLRWKNNPLLIRLALRGGCGSKWLPMSLGRFCCISLAARAGLPHCFFSCYAVLLCLPINAFW